MRHVIPISGKDSLATALVQKMHEPDLPYEYVFNPTGAELPEVFEWIDKVELYLGRPIHRVGEDLVSIIEDNNFFLPSRLARYCTRQSKIEPFEKWIGKEECFVYYGIRNDENRGGYQNNKYPNIIPKYPLKEHGIGINDVYEIINYAGLKPPTFFWKKLYDAYIKSALKDDLSQVLSEWQIDFLFAGRKRANCYFCFNQQKAEWAWLLDTYPELFYKAELMEHNGSEYFWCGKGYPLTKIVENKDRIFNKALNKVRKQISLVRQSKNKQIDLFQLDTEDGFADFFQTTSCGLFCGK